MTRRTSVLSLSLALAIAPAATACSHETQPRSDSTMASSSGSGTMASQGDDHTVTTRDSDHGGTDDTVAMRGEGHATVTTRDSDHDGTDDTIDTRSASDHGEGHTTVAAGDAHHDTTAHGGAPTATDQSEDSHDVDITGRIRQAVVADSSLSLGARNCVIVTQHGHVTLRGDVTRAESAAIVTHAERVAGATNVSSELHVTDGRASH